MLVDEPGKRVNAFREKVAAFHGNAKVAPPSRPRLAIYRSVSGEDSSCFVPLFHRDRDYSLLRRGKFPDRSIRHVPVRSIEIERDRSLRLRVSRRGQIRSVLHPRTKEDLARSVCEG